MFLKRKDLDVGKTRCICMHLYKNAGLSMHAVKMRVEEDFAGRLIIFVEFFFKIACAISFLSAGTSVSNT